MAKIAKLGLPTLAAVLIIGISRAAGDSDAGSKALTIYSTAQPGAIFLRL